MGKKHVTKKKLMSATALCLAGTMVVQSTDWSGLRVFAEDPTLDAAKVLELSFENNVTDGTGKNTVTAVGTENYVAGQKGQAFKFDGNTYLDLGTDTILQSENLTASFWVKRDAAAVGEEILMWCKGEYNQKGWYIGSPNDDNALVFSIGEKIDGGSQPLEFYVQMSRTDFFGTDEWVHVTATYDSETQTAHIYRNGVEVALNTENAGAPGVISSDDCLKVIGSNGGAYGHGGKSKFIMDEVEIFSDAATEEEVLSLYTKNGGVLVEEDDEEKDEEVAVEYIGNISSYDLSNVAVTDAYLNNAEDKDIEYLLSLDSDKLLAGFRETAGLDMKGATRYDGWENSLIGSHTMGHYLTAMAQAVAELPDSDERKAQVEEKLEYIIDALAECQDSLGTGFIFGATILDKNNVELQFDNVEKGLANITTQAWVPWYTMHKILSGVVDTYKLTGNETALEVAKNLGDWVYGRTSSWDTATRNKVLSIEYGGMNDCLYELYAVTGIDKYALAAHAFDEDTLFEAVNKGTANVLNNKHANTTIPKFIGALNRYVTTHGKTIDGEVVDASKYLEYAENFFDMVLERHSYVTGDNSEWEHFGADNVLDAERTNCNCETCNAYNMMKFAKALYMVTGDEKYNNYYETAFYNTILSSQNPETGMTTYFQPMASGYFKVYGEEFTKFWCCTGSGMENFTKLGNAIYYFNDDMVIVNQYLSSVLTDEDSNVKLTQTADIPASEEVSFVVNSLDGSEDIEKDVAFRLPDWLADDAVITVNGEAADAELKSGYAIVSDLQDGDEIDVTLPMEITAYNLPDGESVYAFKYGPIVLSAELGTTNMATAVTGVDVTIPASKLIEEEYISDGSETVSVINGSVEDFIANINENLVKTEGKLEWTLQNTDANLTFVPHYTQHTERYGIYFNYVSNEGAFNAVKYVRDKANERFENALLDTVQPGYGQYENDELHDMQDNGSTGYTDNGTGRYANAGGSFSYSMKVAKGEENALEVSFKKADNGKSIKISVAGTVVYETVLNYDGEEDEYTVRIPVAQNIIDKATSKTIAAGTVDVVDVTFASADANASAAVCSYIYMTKAYSKDASLKLEATAKNAAGEDYPVSISGEGSVINVTVGADAASVDLTSVLVSKYGYVRVNGNIARTELPYTVDVSKNNFVTLTYVVYAEDHETTVEYTVNVTKEADLTDRADADKNLAYFVNCGDYDVTTLSEGDLFGIYNGVTDQAYGKDPVTGRIWGIVDTLSNPLKNGTVTNNPAMTNAVFTDNTWPFETDASVTDESAKTATNRYTKNQFESGIARNLNYSFEVPNGEYQVELYFTDPWGCSKNPIVSAEGEKVLENVAVNEAVLASVDVTDGQLDLNITSPDETLCLNLAYIKIYNPEVTAEDITTDGSTEDTTTEDVTTEDTTVPDSGDNVAVVPMMIMLFGAAAVMLVVSKKKRA